MSNEKDKKQNHRTQIIIAVIGAIAVVIAALVSIFPKILEKNTQESKVVEIVDKISNEEAALQKYGIDKDLISNAINGNADAEAELGWFFWQKENWVESAKWDIKGAKGGNMMGQKRSGLHFQRGLGVKKNYVEAIYWHVLAAKQGDSYSMINLAKMYQTGGFGIEANLEEALKWAEIANKQTPAPEGISELLAELKLKNRVIKK